MSDVKPSIYSHYAPGGQGCTWLHHGAQRAHEERNKPFFPLIEATCSVIKPNTYKADNYEQVCTVTCGKRMPAHLQPAPDLPRGMTLLLPSRPYLVSSAILFFWPALLFVLGCGKSEPRRAANFSQENNFSQLFVNFCHSKGYNTNVYL